MSVVRPQLAGRKVIRATLADGTPVRLRPVLPGDKQQLLEGFRRLSPESRYRRFMAAMEELSPQQLAYLTEIDYVNHYAVIADAPDEPGAPGLGVARYIRDPADPSVAEAAVVVIDDFQGRGLGSLLLHTLGAVALENRITRFRAYFLADNVIVRTLLERLGARFFVDGGMPAAEIELPQQEKELKDTAIYQVLKAFAKGDVTGVRPLPVKGGTAEGR